MKLLVRKPAIVAALIGLATFLVILPAVENGFVWDDATNLVGNPYFRGFSWVHLKWMWTNHLMSHYIPLTWMSFGLDYQIWGREAFGYHLTNILLHAVNAGLFYLLALVLLRVSLNPGRFTPGPLAAGAAFAALLFSLHPLRVESVAWLTERRDLLSGLFYLLALLAYVQPFRQGSTQPLRWKYYWTCLALFLASLLSKEIAVTLPLLLLLLDVYPLRRLGGAPGRWIGPEVRGVWLEKIPFFALSLADGAMTLYVGIKEHLVEPVAALGWMARVSTTVYGVSFYVLKTALPLGLSPLYPLTPHKLDPAALPFQLSAAVVLFVTLTCFVLRHRFPAFITVWVAFCLTLLPVSGIVQNGLQIAADRYTYLPCLGLALLAGAMVTLGWNRSRLSRVLLASACLVILTTLSWLTYIQIGFWRDSDTLWSRAISVEPSPAAYYNLGVSLFNAGDTLGAIDQYRRAIALKPNDAISHNGLGRALLDLHRWQEAAHELRLVEQLMPGMASAYNSLGRILAMQGNFNEAVSQFQEAVRINPNDREYRINLERALGLREQSQTPNVTPQRR